MVQWSYQQNMKRLKANKRKPTPALNTIDTRSRDLIISIYSGQLQNDRLQYSRSRWGTQKKEQSSQAVHKVDSSCHYPLRTTLPVLQFVANHLDLSICSFIFVDGTSLRVVYKQSSIKFAKTKYESAKLKYWLSHLYFFKLRTKLAHDLLQKDQNTNREIVHFYEEKEYLPGHLRGSANISAPLVRKLKLSPHSNYRRHGEAEKRPFCVIHGQNGRQQVASFSQALAFADHKFNLNDLVYIRILSETYENEAPILVPYQKQHEKESEKQLIQKFKSVLSRTEGWQHNKNALLLLKMQSTSSKDFNAYAKLLTLQIIAYIETRHFVAVKKLQAQWILDNSQDLHLSKVWAFDTSQNQQYTLKEGLATLYQKLQTQNTSNTPQKTCFKRQTSTRYKNFKSQEKHRNSTDISELPILTAAKQFQTPTRPKQKSASKLRSKGKSCILRDMSVELIQLILQGSPKEKLN